MVACLNEVRTGGQGQATRGRGLALTGASPPFDYMRARPSSFLQVNLLHPEAIP
jgi:hypothetical protein